MLRTNIYYIYLFKSNATYLYKKYTKVTKSISACTVLTIKKRPEGCLKIVNSKACTRTQLDLFGRKDRETTETKPVFGLNCKIPYLKKRV